MRHEDKMKLIDNCILMTAIITAFLSLYYLIIGDPRLILMLLKQLQ